MPPVASGDGRERLVGARSCTLPIGQRARHGEQREKFSARAASTSSGRTTGSAWRKTT